jgi:hypothetical protein
MAGRRRHLRRSRDGLAERLTRIEARLGAIVWSRLKPTREGRNEVFTALEQIDRVRHELEIQFTRIAQLQAELDAIKRASNR